MKSFYLILPFVLFFTFCSEKVPVPEEKLILVYTDLMFAQDTASVNSKNVDSLKTEVFNRHEIMEEDYKKTLEFYNESPERWEKFFEKVIEYVESLKTKPTDPE